VKRLSKFSLSLIVQVILIVLAMLAPMLHEEEVWGIIWFVTTCAVWDIFLILDWSLCKTGVFRRGAVMHTLPTPIQMLLPFIFLAFQINW